MYSRNFSGTQEQHAKFNVAALVAIEQTWWGRFRARRRRRESVPRTRLISSAALAQCLPPCHLSADKAPISRLVRALRGPLTSREERVAAAPYRGHSLDLSAGRHRPQWPVAPGGAPHEQSGQQQE